jgi:6-phosphogluconolactonase/glucosamine-6-phosphate isomerase/deaminase
VLPDTVKATTIAFVNANSLKRAQSGEQPSNTSGAASSALIPTRKRSVRARATASRSWPKKARMSLGFDSVIAGHGPAIHVFGSTKQDVDARHKAGHDECKNR